MALSVDNILAEGDSLVGKTVTVEGVCTHICKHGGKKLFMMGTDDTKMLRAEACELGSFPAEVVNSLVSVTGTLEEDRINEATIQRMEEQYKNQSGRTSRHQYIRRSHTELPRTPCQSQRSR